MNQEQFKEAIKINDRIKQLKRVLKKFEDDNSCRLSLIYGGLTSSKYDSKFIVQNDVTDLVKDKLKVYTERLIQELKEELKELNKKIDEYDSKLKSVTSSEEVQSTVLEMLTLYKDRDNSTLVKIES